jgi:flagellar biosynthesis component FlhA
MIQFALILVATFMILTGIFTTIPVIGTMILGSFFITIGFVSYFLSQDQDIEQHSKDMWKNGKVFVNTTYKDIKTKIKPKK